MAHEADRLKLHKHKAAENTTILCSLLATCKVLKTVDIRSPKTGISVHYSYSLLMAMQIY